MRDQLLGRIAGSVANSFVTAFKPPPRNTEM